MSKLRIYLPDTTETTENITDPNIISRITSVRRMQVGDNVILFNSAGEYLAKIKDISKKNILISLTNNEKEIKKRKNKLIVAQAISKNNKFDLIVQKATELGIDTIIPMMTAHSIKETINLERMRQIAISATEQSGQLTPLVITAPQSFDEILKLQNKFILHPQATLALNKELLEDKDEICLMIGAEGGFSEDEISNAIKHNAKIIKLGENILRTETATIAILSIINYLLNWS